MGFPGVGAGGRQMGLSSEYSMGTWELVAKEQGAGQWVEKD